MEYVELYRGARLLGVYPLTGRAMEIGKALGCDIQVDDPEVLDRHCLLVPTRRGVLAYDAQNSRDTAAPQLLVADQGYPLGKEHRLLRRTASDVLVAVDEAATAPVAPAATGAHMRPAVGETLVLQVGLGGDARCVRLTSRPLRIGRASDNDVVLHDRAVSAYHCRLETGAEGPLVRDLNSRNGTYLNGVRIERGELAAGMGMRVGHTEMRCCPQESAGTQGRLGVVATSCQMMAVLAEVARLAPLSWPVLLRGETGTGKEGLALALHRLSQRAKGPFVALNAGGLSPQLIESELFGHERGAFTGASGRHEGVFEQAHGGTLFLDEVGELSLTLQAQLLRVIEGGELRRVGGRGAVRVDTRLVFATHRNLPAMVRMGTFRADLYYRIARLVIDVPPLRARPGDIGALSRHFLMEIARTVGPRQLSSSAEARLLAHDWPGNVRELRNVLGMAASCAGGAWIDGPAVDAALGKVGLDSGRHAPAEQLRELVDIHGGNVSAAARAIGWPRSTLRDRLRGESEGSGLGSPPAERPSTTQHAPEGEASVAEPGRVHIA